MAGPLPSTRARAPGRSRAANRLTTAASEAVRVTVRLAGLRKIGQERSHHGFSRRVTVRGIDRHHAAQHRIESRGDLRADGPCRGRRRSVHRQVVERDLSRDRVKEGGAETEDVRPRIGRVGVAGLLGRHVTDGPQLHARPCQAFLAGEPRQTEIEQLGLPVGRHDHVRGLDVAVDELVPVRFDEGIGNLMRDVAREPDRQRRSRRRPLQVGARDQFHHEIGNARRIRPFGGLLAGVDGRHDVRVLELTDRAGFLEEAARACARFARVSGGGP